VYNFDSDDVDTADYKKVAITASLPASMGVGTTAATSQGLFPATLHTLNNCMCSYFYRHNTAGGKSRAAVCGFTLQ